jgi:molecular chaperone DnaJ
VAEKSYYEILEIQKGASGSDIKKAYRQMAKKYHPDRNPGNNEAEEQFKLVNEAYEVLKDDKKRAVYDQYGKAGLQGGAGGSGGMGGFGFDDLGDIFDSFFGGGASRQKRRGVSPDLAVEQKITFKESVFGTKKRISFRYKKPCTSCNGTGAKDGKATECPTCNGRGEVHLRQGFMTFAQTCPECNGEGVRITEKCSECNGKKFIEVSDEVEIDIPAGIDSDHKLRVQGRGNIDEYGSRGDLYVVFTVEKDEHFIRHGDDIYLEVPVFFTQAILGEKIKVPALKGELELKLDQGTRDKQQYTFRGEGVPNIRNYGKGNFIVQIKLTYPQNLNSEQEDLLHELQESFGIESKPHENLYDKIINFFK